MIVFHFLYINLEVEQIAFPPKLTDRKKITETFLVAVLTEILAKDGTKPFLKHKERVLGREAPWFFLDK